MAERTDANLHKMEVEAANKTQVSIINLLARMKISLDRPVRVKIYEKYKDDMAKANPGKNFNEPYTGKSWQNLAMVSYIKGRILAGEILDGKTLEFRTLADSKSQVKGVAVKDRMDVRRGMPAIPTGSEVFGDNLTPAQILQLSGFEILRNGKVVGWTFRDLDTPTGKINSSRGFLLTKIFLKEFNKKDQKGELVYNTKDKVTLAVYKHLWERIYRGGKVGDKYHINAYKQSQAFLKSEIDRLEKVVSGKKAEKREPVPVEPAPVPEPRPVPAPAPKPVPKPVVPVAPKPAPVRPPEPAIEPRPAPVPKPVVPVAPKALDRPAEIVAPKETVAWNKDIVLTFDDSLNGAEDIIQRLEKNGIKDYRFFAEFATALKPSVLKDMGVFKNQRSDKITPGKWLSEYIDMKRGSMSRTDYIRQHMIKDGSDGKSTDYKSMGSRIKAKFQQMYPTNWMDKLQETFAYHAAILHPLNSGDRKNHIQFWSPEQVKEDIETFEEFMKAWLDVPDFKIRYLRPPVGGGFGFDTAWKGSGSKENATKLENVVKSFRPDAKWQLWNVDSGDTRTHGSNVDNTDLARRAVANLSKKDFRDYEPRGKTIVLMHTKNYSGKNGRNLDSLAQQIDTKYKEHQEKKDAPVEKTKKPPTYDETVNGMKNVEKRFRHYFSVADKKFIADTIAKFKSGLVDQNKDQYLVVVDRAKQFAALVYFSASDDQYKIVGNFGAMTSTGNQKPGEKSWATPIGAYNLQPFIDKRETSGKPEWRTEGTGGAGFGPKGSRVFHLGYVNVNSPFGKNASIAMHKTSRKSLNNLGKTSQSHGCIRVADGFIDLLDKQKLLDSEYGHHVVVGDSSTDNKPKYTDVDHGKRELSQ